MTFRNLFSSFIVVSLVASFAFAQRGKKDYVPGEVLIKFKDAADSASSRFARETGSRALENVGNTGWKRIKLPASLGIDKAIERYRQRADVESIQPNFYYHLLTTPNDPQYGSLWGMAKISAPTAWDLTTGSAAVVVADIDTGIRYSHEDLAANVWTNPGEIPNNGIDDDGNGFIDDYYGYDFFYNDPDPLDENGHGTHTAGTIGAAGNNSLGVTGVNWNVKIMAIKIYSAVGTDSTSAMLVNAYNYVRMMKERGVNIKVTNNSYGDCPEACGADQAVKEALDALGNAGVLNVFAAGNNGRNIDTAPFYPASYTNPTILSVAASDSSDDRAGFSNYGVNSVDIAAPGVSILSTIRNSDSGYGFLSGTSMAAPHVAGAAALLASYDPALSPVSLKATLMNNVDQLANWNGIVRSGGRLNVAKTLQNPTVCTFNLATDSILVRTRGGYYSVDVNAPSNCDYSVKSSVKWIYFDGAKDLTGTGTANFRVTVNPTISRSATVTIAGQTVTITQSRN
ncbi:MAG TPA: S8 family serine peptidase [Pyrinomonadaceae bacterium]|nr:S8 family serine peptidase [Pyrinomonadaceae bacterium]